MSGGYVPNDARCLAAWQTIRTWGQRESIGCDRQQLAVSQPASLGGFWQTLAGRLWLADVKCELRAPPMARSQFVAHNGTQTSCLSEGVSASVPSSLPSSSANCNDGMVLKWK